MSNDKIKTFLIEEIASIADFSIQDDFVISGGNPNVLQLFLDAPFSIEGVAISVCISGCGKAKIGFREQNISRGTLLILIPELIVEPIEKSEDLLLKTIFFSHKFISEMQYKWLFAITEKIMALPCMSLSETEFDYLMKFYSLIEDKVVSDVTEYRGAITKSLLFALILEICSIYAIRQSMSQPQSHTDKLVDKFIKLIHENYKKEHKVSFYADALCVTDKYLMSVIKNKTGKTINGWISSAITAYAKRELKNSDKTIYKIAAELNFISSSLFCRHFRTHTGLTPKQYRKIKL